MNIDDVIKEENFSFAKNTTYRCGGNAKVAYFPQTAEQAERVFSFLKEKNISFVTVGNGSNILASDKGYEGAVISTKHLSGIEKTCRDTLFCLAGTKVSTLLKFCAENGLGGLEYLSGIPATIGGIVYMNGGAGGTYINQNVVSVRIFDGSMRDLSNKNCQFGYKYSTMRDINCLILGAELKIVPKSREKVEQDILYFSERRSGHPKGASCGCVFKNHGNISAGKLIDEAGLKGLTIGNAAVSGKHANFIINKGTSSSDVRALIDEVRRRVFDRTGIILEEEVVYIGDF